MLQQSSDPTMTLTDFWEIYKADMEKRLRKTTMKQKEYVMNDKILPYLGKTPINEITAHDTQIAYPEFTLARNIWSRDLLLQTGTSNSNSASNSANV